MSNYINGTSMSYIDYLQAKSFEEGIKYEISKNTREIIASNEELQREHITATEDISRKLVEGFEELSVDMKSISRNIEYLTSVFQWGFSELLTGIGHINDSLSELVKTAKTPAQTWAYEQFEIARDAFRRGLYNEALEYLNRAIFGHGDNTGYKIEYRFHFLLGTLRIGSHKNNSPSIVHLDEAEKAYLSAAKYASHDNPKEAAQSMLAAGWAAYCQGKIQESEKYTKQAISLNSDMAEGYFQLAKIMMNRNDPEHAIEPLKKSIELDRIFALKSGSDDDFNLHKKYVNMLMEQLRRDAQEKTNTTMSNLSKELSEFIAFHVQEYSANSADISSIRQLIDRAKISINHKTYFGYLDAFLICSNARNELHEVKQQFIGSSISDVRNKIRDAGLSTGRIRESGMRTTWNAVVAIGIALSFVISLGETVGTWIDYMIFGLLISFAIGKIGNYIQKQMEIQSQEREIERLVEVEKGLNTKKSS